MSDLVPHLVALSGLRDRTALNQRLAQAAQEQTGAHTLCLWQVLQGGQRLLVQPAVRFDQGTWTVQDAYLPPHDLCRPMELDPLLHQCVATLSPVHQQSVDGGSRHVFPVGVEQRLRFLLDVHLADAGETAALTALHQLLDFFANHLGIINYSETDTLTHLLNRKTFDEHLFRILGLAATDNPLDHTGLPQRRQAGDADLGHWLAVADIDHFKRVNDTYGHLIGDEVLILVARLMRESLRLNDQLFRFGGEEFVALLQPTSRRDVAMVVERVRTTVEAYAFPQVGHITVSIGYTRIRPLDTPTNLLDRADDALYFAKHHGRNQIHAHEDLVDAGHLVAASAAHSDVELF